MTHIEIFAGVSVFVLAGAALAALLRARKRRHVRFEIERLAHEKKNAEDKALELRRQYREAQMETFFRVTGHRPNSTASIHLPTKPPAAPPEPRAVISATASAEEKLAYLFGRRDGLSAAQSLVARALNVPDNSADPGRFPLPKQGGA